MLSSMMVVAAGCLGATAACAGALDGLRLGGPVQLAGPGVHDGAPGEKPRRGGAKAGEPLTDGEGTMDGGGDATATPPAATGTANASAPPPDVTAGDILRDCTTCPEMVVLPAGSFVMGSPPNEEGRALDEGPLHTVTIGSPFAVGRYEVTWEEWEACVRGGGCEGAGPLGAGGAGSAGGTRPVSHVTWQDARDYADWLARETGESYRLLTEAEWEYAARAGTTGPYSNGGGAAELCSIANHLDLSNDGRAIFRATPINQRCSDGVVGTAPVGSYAANAFGLHDMHGNVSEWVQDCYRANYAGAPTDGSAATTGACVQHVARGGDAGGGPSELRSASREERDPGDRSRGVGFRVARSLVAR